MNKPFLRSKIVAAPPMGSSSEQLDAGHAPRRGSPDPARWSLKRVSRIQVVMLVFLSWTAVGLFMAIPVMYDGMDWRGNLLDKLIDCWSWAILTPALVFVDRNFAAKRTSGTRLVLLYLLLCVPVVLVHTLLTAVLLYPFSLVTWSPFRDSSYTVFYILGGLEMYAAVVGVLEALRFYNNYVTGQLQLERVQKSLVESRLNALRLHLEPHFLFNALNAISSELGDNPALAREMIGDLGALLRRSLDCKDKNEITLAQELAVLERYLAIQRVRFGDRIKFDVEVGPEMLAARVPSMLLQPLVENSIRHGVEGLPSGGTISISASRAGEHLEIRVTDDGAGLPPHLALEEARGHGIRVTRERLAALYPEAGENCFSIARRSIGGTEVVVRIPLRGGSRDGAIV